MKTSDFDYKLPESFIAQTPVSPRDSSKLLIFDTSDDRIFHKKFSDLPEFLTPNDVLVLNQSQVVPARLAFYDKTKRLEVFLIRKSSDFVYKAMVFPGKFFKKGKQFSVNEKLSGIVEGVFSDGSRSIKFDNDPFKFGSTPLPPYIKNKSIDSSLYQTVYAKDDGSVAAPTAGLHFTKNLLRKIELLGVDIVKLTLHVGPGTFLPVTSEDLSQHKMHSEWYEVSPDVAFALNKAIKIGKRIVAVGTTSVRVLEAVFSNENGFAHGFGETDIFIYPGNYKWKVVDALITNFHLPKSTLLMLVSSFLEHKGVENSVSKVKDIYSTAMANDYRFFSFGDAMFLS